MMRQNVLSWTGAAAWLGWVLVASAGGAATGDAKEGVGDLWGQMRRADVASAEFKAAQWKLTARIGTMPMTRRTAAATAMMDRLAGPEVNAEALRCFGTDPLPITDIQRILWDARRGFSQRILLKTYYSFCRAKAPASILTETARRQLVDVLAERLDNLAGTKVSYGEQRLLTHLASAVLSRYAHTSQTVPQAKGLIAALAKYADKAGKADGFGAAIPAWLDLAQSGKTPLDTFGQAVQALGHWDPLVRWRAASQLGERDVPADDKAARVVLSLLDDRRDEVRSAAAQVFAVARDYRADVVVPKMVELLVRGRGVIVQAAAAEALIARSSQAQGQVDALVAAMNDPARVLGSSRTSQVLLVLSKLVGKASLEQKEQVLVQAARHMVRSPDGALAVMQALGPQAARAVPGIREYRATTDRFRRIHIDRHVLPAILPAGSAEP